MSVLDQSTPLDAIPEILRWDEGEKTARLIHDEWEAVVRDRGQALLDDLRGLEGATALDLSAALETLPKESLDRLLLAPETTFRLFWRQPAELAEVARFFERAIAAEQIRAGIPAKPDSGCWTALGDFGVDGLLQAPVVTGIPCVDMDSPIACTVDLTGEHYVVDSARSPLTGLTRALVIERLEEVASALPAAGDLLPWFVSHFTKVLILQREDDQPFSSGSNGQFVGRSVVANPHLAGIDSAVVADAIVHEAIHSLLYMQELRRPWVLDDGLYDTTARTVSPWSGRELPLRPFLQACFVWYGLLNFWARIHASDALAEGSRRELLLRAASGFLGEPLRLQLESYQSALRDEVITAVDEMQNDVAECFAGAL